MFELSKYCRLFYGMDEDTVDAVIDNHGIRTEEYAAGEIIAIHGSAYRRLMIVAEGSVYAETQRHGKKNHVETIVKGSIIHPNLIYADHNKLPADLIAGDSCTLLVIPKEDLSRIMTEYRKVMENFIGIISSANRFSSDKALYLTYKSIKARYSNFIIEKAAEKGSNEFRNEMTQEAMAAMFGVTRPALARAIREICEDGAIYVKGKNVSIIFPDKLKQYSRSK